jgi:hypothetical protein
MRRFVLPLVVLACAAGLLRGQAYEIKVKAYPAKGQSVKHTDTSKQVTHVKVTDGDGKVIQDKKEVADVKQVYVETSVTESVKGRPSKFTRKYEKSATTKDGETKADAYEGETIAFELGKGGKYVAKAEGKKELSEEDKKKLEEDLNREGRATDPMQELMPDKAVKVGDSWEIAGKKLAAFIGGKDVTADKSKGKGKLVKVYKKGEQQWGTIEVSADIAMTIEKAPTKTGFTMTLEVAIDGSSSAGKAKAKMTLTQDREVEQNCMKFKVSIKSEISGDIDRVEVK